jgi:hypothetical protein
MAEFSSIVRYSNYAAPDASAALPARSDAVNRRGHMPTFWDFADLARY